MEYLPGGDIAIRLKTLYDNFDFDGALLEKIDDPKLRLRADYWEAKAYYNLGEYKTSLEKADAQVKLLLEKFPDLHTQAKKEEIILSLTDDENDTKIQEIKKIEVEPHICYIFLKYRLLQARINKGIAKNPEAHDIVNSIVLLVKKLMEQTTSKYMLIAVKAVQVQMTQLCNAKEFESALLMLKNIGAKVT